VTRCKGHAALRAGKCAESYTKAWGRGKACSLTLQPDGHELAVGIFHVVGKGTAVGEAHAFVEGAGGSEILGRAGFQTQAFITTLARDVQHMVQEMACHPAATMAVRGAHRFDF